MPVYKNPSLLDNISDELKQRMQGKSCFNFKKNDPGLIKELVLLTKDSFEDYIKQDKIQI